MIQKAESMYQSDDISMKRDQAGHYHVRACFRNGTILAERVSKTEHFAEDWLAWAVENLRDSHNRLKGSVKSRRFEITKRVDALCDYLVMFQCEEQGCESTAWNTIDGRVWRQKRLQELHIAYQKARSKQEQKYLLWKSVRLARQLLDLLSTSDRY